MQISLVLLHVQIIITIVYHTVASYSQPTRQNSDANLYENCAVSFGYRESDFAKCKLFDQLQTLVINVTIVL